MRLKFCTCLGPSKQNTRYDRRCAIFTSFFLFHFIFELHNILMVMINVVKIESVNATENCLVNIFSVRTFFYQSNYSLSISVSRSRSRSRGLDIIWTNIFNNILNNEWELKVAYQQNFPVGKKLTILYLAKEFPSGFAVNVW